MAKSNKKKSVREPAIKMLASMGGMKVLADDTISMVLMSPPDQLVNVTKLLSIKQDGDSLSLSIVRVKAKKENASQKQTDQKEKAKPRRVKRKKRYPYKD